MLHSQPSCLSFFGFVAYIRSICGGNLTKQLRDAEFLNLYTRWKVEKVDIMLDDVIIKACNLSCVGNSATHVTVIWGPFLDLSLSKGQF
jgi:hypothetical protein